MEEYTMGLPHFSMPNLALIGKGTWTQSPQIQHLVKFTVFWRLFDQKRLSHTLIKVRLGLEEFTANPLSRGLYRRWGCGYKMWPKLWFFTVFVLQRRQYIPIKETFAMDQRSKKNKFGGDWYRGGGYKTPKLRYISCFRSTGWHVPIKLKFGIGEYTTGVLKQDNLVTSDWVWPSAGFLVTGGIQL